MYIDDILVFSKIKELHAQDVTKILTKLWEHKLYANAKKSEFFLEELEFLGHVLNGEGIKSNLKKIEVIVDWEVP